MSGETNTETTVLGGVTESVADPNTPVNQPNNPPAEEMRNPLDTNSEKKVEETSTENKEADPEKKEDDPKVEGAPDKYEDFKIAEGLTLQTEVVTEFKQFAKEMNWSQDQAQKVVDFQNKMELARVADLQKASQEAEEASQKAWTELTDGWRNTAKADKEFGGQNYDASIGVANKVIDRFGTPEFREAMNFSGLGDHPELIRIFARIGKVMSEETSIFTGGAGSNESVEKRLFPSMNADNK